MNPDEEWIRQKNIAEGTIQKKEWKIAENAFLKALSVAEAFGERDQRLCWTVEAVANVLQQQQAYHKAERYLERAFMIKRNVLGQENLTVGYAADSLARACYYSHNYDKAELYAKLCVEIYERVLGLDHKDVATVLANQAMLYHVQKKYAQAEPLYKRAMQIRTKTLGNEHPDTVKLLKYYADLLKATHREAEAEHMTTCATGLITGSWKAIVVPDEQLLADEESCMFCGSSLKGRDRCKVCGTTKGRSV